MEVGQAVFHTQQKTETSWQKRNPESVASHSTQTLGAAWGQRMRARRSATLRADITEEEEYELSLEGSVSQKRNRSLGKHSREDEVRGQAQKGLRAQYSYDTMLIGG